MAAGEVPVVEIPMEPTPGDEVPVATPPVEESQDEVIPCAEIKRRGAPTDEDTPEETPVGRIIEEEGVISRLHQILSMYGADSEDED